MEAIPVLTLTKDLPGLSEEWQVYVGFDRGVFWWGTDPSDQENDSDAEDADVEWIDQGTATYIAEYLFEQAAGRLEEMSSSLEEIASLKPEYRPLAADFNMLMANA